MLKYLVFSIIITLLPFQAHAATVLTVPFSTQAPQNQWRTQPFADACEETVVIMVEAFYKNAMITPQSVRQRILKLAAYEQKYFGFHRDTNSTYTARLLNEQTSAVGTIVENPTVEQVTQELDEGRPVILPAFSDSLKNPRYRAGGNPYHVILIIGYDAETSEFITHDPGTRFGKNYRYPIERLMDANHDYQKPNYGTGGRFMVFTAPQK